MNNLITDVPGLRAGNAHCPVAATGVTAVIFDRPAVASIAIHGGAPGVRDAALLEPDMTVAAVDALVLAGGSVFGLDAMGGVVDWLRQQGRGFPVGPARAPIAPGAILFDLNNGGDKDWGEKPLYRDLGRAAAACATADRFELGTAGAGYGATTAGLKGGLGSASARAGAGFTIGALVAVNALGSALIGEGPHFWAAPYERGGEFGGLGWPARIGADDLRPRVKGRARVRENTTIAILATDAPLDKAAAKRLAVMAHDGMARALRPVHAPLDGDVAFAASTADGGKPVAAAELTELGACAADCLARAIARGVFLATALPFPGALPAWADRFGATRRPD